MTPSARLGGGGGGGGLVEGKTAARSDDGAWEVPMGGNRIGSHYNTHFSELISCLHATT